MMQRASNSETINCVKNYLSAEIQSLEFNLKNSYVFLDEKAVHDFRVSLKKLRAGFSFLRKSGLLPGKKPKILLDIKPAFRSGGELRDLQVIHHLIKIYEQELNEHFMLFRSFITREMLFVADEFKVKSKAVLPYLENTVWDEVLNKINHIPDIRVEAKKVIGKTFRRAKKILFKPEPDTHSYHEIRKLLKKARFIFEMNMADDWNGTDYHAHLNGLKKLESLLGAWHDRISLLNRLGVFMDQGKRVSEDYSVLMNQVEKDITEDLLSFDALFMFEYYWFYQLAVGVK